MLDTGNTVTITREEYDKLVQAKRALRRFADDDNWREDELRPVWTWQLQFDPAAFARSMVGEPKPGDRQGSRYANG